MRVTAVETTFRELELQTLRRMTAAQKIAVMHSLWHTAWTLTAASLRSRHPDWTESELHARVRQTVARDPA